MWLTSRAEAIMGFLEYAWAISLQKDELKTRICIDPQIHQPILLQDENGAHIILPVPSVSQDKTISFLGCRFLEDQKGKVQVGRLFRACVLHVTAHAEMTVYDEADMALPAKNNRAEIFARTLIDDVYVNTCISSKCSDRLIDVAFANSIAFSRMKPLELIYNQATRIMAALLSKVNVGIVKGKLQPEEEKVVNLSISKLKSLKERFLTSSQADKPKLFRFVEEAMENITADLESLGPIVESPSFPHHEQTGPCSVFSRCESLSEAAVESAFRNSLETLGLVTPPEKSIESFWGKASETESLQAYDSWFHQREREQRIMESLKECTESTRFKSISFPEEDYTQYLRARAHVSGGSRRLLDSLRIAQDALDEDPRKEMGQLDLSTVIQVIASRKPVTDVFVLEEYLSRSFAWGILFDVSASMKVKGEFARALVICIAEATKELLMDPGSWTLFAFSDQFYILKHSTEPYSRRIRARIGGLKFGGLTYMPDAIQLAGNILMKRYGEQRILVVISDGWPYGYANIRGALKTSVNSLEKKGIIVIGVGVETERMKRFFKLNSPIYSQKDLIRNFSKIFHNASTAALET